MAFDEQTDIKSPDGLLMMALRQRSCPICLILQSKSNDLMCELQFEAVHNPEVNARLLSAGGYCHFHFWYMEKLASPATNAQLLERLLARLESEFLGDPNGAVATGLDEQLRCPICCFCNDWEEKLLNSFAARTQEREFCAAYETSHGLCLPHLAKLLKRLPNRDQRVFLVACSRCQLTTLREQLRLLITKWGNKDHRLGEEKDSAYRAIGKLVGGKYYQVGRWVSPDGPACHRDEKVQLTGKA
ncbi:MAG TPA: DUF6062 family protein [Candidatus Binatia bacterium]|jgi:hypothetical protein